MSRSARRRFLPLFFCLLAGAGGTTFSPPAVAQPAARAIPVTGIVLEGDGTPFAGADVRLHRLPSLYRKGRLRAAGRAWLRPEVTAKTGRDGRFQITAPAPGPWTLVVHAPERAAMQYPLSPLVEATDLPPVRLARTAPVRVRVVGPDGKPVAGATLAVRCWGQRSGRGTEGLWRPVDLRTGTTGSDGVARMRCGTEESLQLEAVAGRRSGFEKSVHHAAEVTVRLDDGPVRRLVARDPEGHPVPRAVVWGQGSLPVAVTGADGGAEVALRGEDPLPVRVDAPDGSGGAGVLDLPKKDDTVTAPPPVEIVVAPPVEVVGRVVAVDNGAPLTGAWAWFRGEPDQARETDQKGIFHLFWPARSGSPGASGPPSKVHLEAVAAGYVNNSIQADREARDLPVIRLDPTAFVTGIVVDPGGQAVADAEVHLVPRHAPRGPGEALRPLQGGFSRTGADGRFRIDRLSRDSAYAATATAPGYGPAEAKVPKAEEGAARLADLRLVLGPVGQLRGRAVTAEGEPVPGARVAVVPRTGEEGFGLPPQSVDGVADDDGVFVLSDLATGDAALAVVAPGRVPATLDRVEVPEEGGTVDVGDVVLDEEARLDGRVVGPDGAGLPDVALRVWASGQRRSSGERRALAALEEGLRTDAQGRFRVPGAQAGVSYSLMAVPREQGFPPAIRDGVVPPLDEPLTIQVGAASSVSGVVVDGAGRPVAGVSVSASVVHSSGSSSQSGPSTDEEGRFQIDWIPPGTVVLRADGNGYITREPAVVQVAPGEAAEGARIEVMAGGRLTGRVIDGDGAPVRGAQVQVYWKVGVDSGMQGRSAVVAADGTFVCEGVPPQEVDVHASAPGYPEAQKSVVAVGPAPSVELVLHRGVEVSGQVVDGEDQPVAWARITLSGGSGSSRTRVNGETDADGAFRISGVAPGAVTLTVRPPDSRQAVRRVVEVGEAGLSGLVVRLSAEGRIVGRILGVDTDRLARVDVSARSEGGRVSGRVLPDGTYEITGLLPGSWWVTGEVRDAGLAAQEVVPLEAGEEAVRDLSFDEGITLDGQVLLGGMPGAGLAVRVFGRGDRVVVRRVACDAEGRFRVTGLGTGPAEVQVYDEGHEPLVQRQIELPADRDLVLDIALHAVTGSVVAADGTGPLRAAQLSLWTAAGPGAAGPGPVARKVAVSGNDGTFRFDHVSEGDWRLHCELTGYKPVDVPVHVAGFDLQVPPIQLSPFSAPPPVN